MSLYICAHLFIHTHIYSLVNIEDVICVRMYLSPYIDAFLCSSECVFACV